MANRKITYQVGFEADTSQLQAALLKAQEALQKISTQPVTGQLKEASQAALDLSLHLAKAYNQQTGKLDLTAFNKSLKQSNTSLTDYANRLIKIGPAGEEAFLQVANAIAKAELPIKRSNKLLDELWVTMKNTMRWQLTSSVLQGFTGAIHTALGYSKDLNRSLNSIQIVSSKSSEEMAKFADNANKAAKNLSTTTVDYTDASLVYYQQGLADKEVEDRTNTTIKLANVSRETAEEASQQMTAIWNNFDDGSKSLEYYADVLTALGAKTASSTQEISAGIQKFAATASSIGLSYEYATAALATITAITRESAETVGNAYNTLFARIQGLMQDETQDDGTTLNKYSQALANVGINIKDTSGELKGMNAILDEMGAKWTNLSKAQQLALAQTVGGVRQYRQLIALMDNWTFFQENLATAMGSEGSLNKQAEIYAKSWEAARNRVKAATEDIYDSLVNEDFFIGVADFFTPILSGVATVVDALGGMQGVLATLALLMNKIYGEKIASSMREMATLIGVQSGLEAKRARERQQEALQIVEDLELTYAADEAQSLRLRKMKEEIGLHSTINEKMDSFNESQKEWIKDEEYKISLLGQEYDRIVENLEKQTADVNQRKETIYLEADFSEGTLQNIGNFVDSNKEKIESLWGKNQKGESFFDLNFMTGKDADTPEKIFNKLNKELANVAKQRVALENARTSLKRMSDEGKITTEQISEINEALSAVGVNKIDQNTQDIGKALEDRMNTLVNKTKVLNEALTSFGGDSRQIAEFSARLLELTRTQEYAEMTAEQQDEAIEKLSETVRNEAVPSIDDWASKLVRAGDIISQVILVANSFKSLGEIFSNEDTSGIEKMVALLTNMTMILPTVISLAKALHIATQISITKEGEQFIVRTAGIAATRAKAAADKALAAGESEVAASTAAANAALLPQILVIGAIVAAIAGLVIVFSNLGKESERATKRIEDATEEFKSQKSALESLNSELESTKNRIQEINNLDTISVVEQEELDRLKQRELLLQRQADLQEKLAKNATERYQKTIEEDFVTSTQDLVDKNPNESGELSSTYSFARDKVAQNIQILSEQIKNSNGEEKKQLEEKLKIWQNFEKKFEDSQVDPDLWLAIELEGLDKNSKDYEEEVKAFTKQAEELWDIYNSKQADFERENGELLQEKLQQYDQYILNILGGADYDETKLAEIQDRVKALRLLVYSPEEYEQTILTPLLDSASFNFIKKDLYNAILEDRDAINLISPAFKEQLLLAGVSIDDFIEWQKIRFDTLNQNLSKYGAKLEDFSEEDWDLLLKINFNENIKTLDDVYKALEKIKKEEKINIELNVDGLEQLQEALELINKSESPLEKALSSYKSQGYLNMDQVQDLIKDYPEYAKYITKVGDAYYLTNQALTDFIDKERLEQEVLDETLSTINETNLSYLEDFQNLYAELAQESSNWQRYSFKDATTGDFYGSLAKNLQSATKAFQDGSISVDEYFNTINSNLKQIGNGFTELRKSQEGAVDRTDWMEKMFTTNIGIISKEMVGLAKQLQKGDINLDTYYDGIIAGTKALITAQSQLNPHITKNAEGLWEIKDGLELSDEELSQAYSDISNLNIWEEQVEGATSLSNMVKELCNDYEYLEQFIQASGDISIPIDFDTTSVEFQSMAERVSREIAQLYDNNKEVFDNITKGMQESGIEFSDNLSQNQQKILNYMTENGTQAEEILDNVVYSLNDTINNTADAVGGILTALGNLINNFDYTIKLSGNIVENGSSLRDIVNAVISGEYSNIKLPEIDYNITGSAGEAAKNFASQISKAGSFFSAMGKTSVLGRGGANNLGVKTLDSGVLNPNLIETDNIRNKEKSSKGGEKQQEELKDLEDIEERYHEINRQIERQNDLLDDINNSIDRAYGGNKLSGFSKQLAALTKQQENYQRKMAEAQAYRAQDLARLQSLFDKIQLDANGEILNYSELLRQTIDEHNAFLMQYNAFLAEYSAMTKAEQEANEAAYNAWVARKEMMEDTFQMRQDALKMYEDTLDVIQEMRDSIEDNLRKQADAKLSQVEYKLEIVLDVKGMRDALREFDKQVNEIFGDALTHGIPVAKLDYDQAQAEADMYPEYKRQFEELKDLYESSDEYMDRERIINDIKDLQSKVLGSAEAIVEWVNSIEDLIPAAVDAARERYNLFMDQLEHNNTVLDTIKELYALQNVTYKTMDGFNRLQKVSQGRLDSQLARAELQKKWYDEARIRLEEAQARLDSLGGDETDLRYDTYKKARDSFLEEFNDAEEKYLSLAKDAMQTAQEMYEQQLERAVYKFGQIVSGGIGLDLLQDKYDHYIETNERYFDKVNEAYQVTAWYNKLQADIDKATNTKTKDRLKALQDEINIRRQGNKLSQYDLDILNAKYQVLQAQMALEDAQNAKNKLQLVRDSQGNWNYQYTADADQVASAQQNLLDKENEWYNIAKQQVTDVTSQIISTWQECQDKIKEIYSDMTLTDEERSQKAQEIYKYYTDKIKYLENEKQIAIADMTQAGNEGLVDAAIVVGDTISDLTGLTTEDIKTIIKGTGASINQILSLDLDELKQLIYKNNNKIIDDLEEGSTVSKWIVEEALQDIIDRLSTDSGLLDDILKEHGDDIARELGIDSEELKQSLTGNSDEIREKLTEDSELLATILKYSSKEIYNSLAETSDPLKNLLDTLGNQIVENSEEDVGSVYDIINNGSINILDILDQNSKSIEDIMQNNINSIDIFDNSFAKDLDNMTKNTINFEDVLERTLLEIEGHFQKLQETTTDIAEKTGTSFDNLKDKTDEVSDSTDILRQKGIDAASALWQMIDYTKDLAYQQIDLAKNIWDTVEALRALAQAQLDYVAAKAQGSGSYSSSGSSSGGGSRPSTGGNGLRDYINDLNNGTLVEEPSSKEDSEKVVTMSDGTKYIYDKYGNLLRTIKPKNPKPTSNPDIIQQIDTSGRQDGAPTEIEDKRIVNFTRENNGYIETVRRIYNQNWSSYTDVVTKREKIKKPNNQTVIDNNNDRWISTYATGGYTGEFEGGRLAVLHQKELVLNENDTLNMLKMVDITRSLLSNIEKTLDGNAMTAMNLMASRFQTPAAMYAPDSIEQTIHIDEVTFPSVVSSDEIQQAFVSIANDAAQWARRRKE